MFALVVFRRWLLCVLLAVVTAAPAAHAQPRGLLLGYEAPPECPNRDFFWGQLWARSSRLQWMRPGELAITVNARMARVGLQYVGHLRLVDSAGAVVEREVGGPTCWDVSAALSLITAVSLDALPAQWQPALPVPARQKESTQHWALGAVVGMHTAVAHEVVPTLGLSATFHDRQRYGSPELRFEALVSLDTYKPVFDEVTRSEVGQARFLWVSSRTTACPFQLNLASTTLGPCAVIELGRLKGSGSTDAGTGSQTGWWFAPGAVLNWSLQAGPIWVRAAGGAVRPLVQDTFQFRPKPEIFPVPSHGTIGEFELGWAF